MWVFSLGWWCTQIPTRRLRPRSTWEASRACLNFAYGAITHFGQFSQTVQLFIQISRWSPATPVDNSTGLGCSLFARHYLGNLNWFLFLEVLRCFNSLRVPLTTTLLMMRWLGITPAGLLHSETHGSNACLVANRVLSWPTPSFVVSISRGIHLELKSLKISKFFLYS